MTNSINQLAAAKLAPAFSPSFPPLRSDPNWGILFRLPCWYYVARTMAFVAA